jgi:ribbon-helix-helix protein
LLVSTSVLSTDEEEERQYQRMKRTVVWLTNEQTNALEQMSETTLAPISALVRQAVKEFLERNTRKTRRKTKGAN